LSEQFSKADVTLIGGAMKIKGEIVSSEELRIDGEVEGRIELENQLTIGPNGKVDAQIKATEVVVIGSVKGNLEASERVILRSGANLVGNVKTAAIVIEDGAYFKGGIDITPPDTA
jgi:cytoskeletal protein CcmA (bactofilin family)